MTAKLAYNKTQRRWEGEDTETQTSLWMDNATFERHVWEYLSTQRIYQPLLGDVEHARQDCQEWEYWQGCTDPDVHWHQPKTRMDQKRKPGK